MGVANISGNILTDSGTNLSSLVSGSGTSSYYAKFTGTSTIGNSMLTDDGTTLQSIGATRSNLYLKAADNTYYSQLAFTNGTNGSFGGLSYNNSGQYMQFETNSSEWMRLTSTGRLGIGTTSPSTLLDVNGAAKVSGTLTAGLSNGNIRLTGSIDGFLGVGASDGKLYLADWTTANKGLVINMSSGYIGMGTAAPLTKLQLVEVGGPSVIPTLTLSQDGDLGLDWVAGAINFYSYDGSSNSKGGIGNIRVAAETAYNTGATPSYMAFYTHPNSANNNTTFGAATEKVRITSTGNLLIGDTTGTAKLLVNAGVTSEGSPHVLLGGNGYSGFHWMNNTAYYIGQNSQSRDLRIYSGNNTAVGVVLNPNATSWTGYSDERLKTNIDNFDSVLQNVLSLRAIKYHFKDVDTEDSQKRYGLIAQDLVGKFDEVLSKSKFSEDDETEYYGVRYTELIPVLVKAIQELSAKVTALENKTNP